MGVSSAHSGPLDTVLSGWSTAHLRVLRRVVGIGLNRARRGSLDFELWHGGGRAMTQHDQQPGEGIPLPGVAAQKAVEQWAIGKLIDYRQSVHMNTAIINDLDLDTLCVTFHTTPHADGGSGLVLVMDADTLHGGHFQQVIPWSPMHVTAEVVQIIQSAGGVVHA
jgi:hypothetical protein